MTPDPKKAVLLPEIVVTARPILEETRLDALGGLVTIMTPKQISDMNALDLPSALRRLPGVVISRYNLVGGYGGGDGARYNDSRYFGSDWGWQAGVAAEQGRTRLHLQHSRAFNLPGVYVAIMYNGWGRPDEWKDLSAEVLDHNEVGLRIRPYAKLELEVNAFYDEVHSALRWIPPVIPPPPPFQPPRFSNSGHYLNRGLEANLSAETGPATLFALTLGPKGRWRLISSPVRVVDGGPLVGLVAPHFKIAPERDVREWLTDYAKSGGPHHNAICFGDATGRIAAAARMLDAEHVAL